VLPAHIAAVLCLTFGSAVSRADDIVIRMVDTAKDGPLTFDPIFVTAKIGDTLVFTPESKGHTTQSLLVPEGAKPWKSGYDKATRIIVEKEGIYLYGCEAHLRMGMVGVVQVGQPVNLEAARKTAAAAGAQFVMNKDRFVTALARVR
jgi:pseudoazurin